MLPALRKHVSDANPQTCLPKAASMAPEKNHILNSYDCPMPHRKTCKRYNDPGHAHALTFSCFRRQAFLSKPRSCIWLIDSIDRAREKLRFHVWAYVIMPEHAHLLIWPTEQEYDVSKILKCIKLSITRKA